VDQGRLGRRSEVLEGKEELESGQENEKEGAAGGQDHKKR